MAAFVPTIVSVDVEPDRRPASATDRPPWDGWAAAHEVLAAARPRFAAESGAAVHWSWFFRTDPQVAALWGSGGFPIEAHRARVDEVVAAGDEIGVHCHPFRLEDGAWVDDYRDGASVARAADAALDAFETATGRPCRSFRFGARWLDDAAARRVAARGVAFDLTVEPGFHDVEFAVGDRLGDALDYRRAPRRIYRPDGHFLRVGTGPGANGRPWVIPLSTGTPERPWRGFRRRLRNLVRRPARGRPWAPLCLAESPRVFSRVLDRLLSSRRTTHLSAVVRSDAALPPLRAVLEANLAALEARVRPHRLRVVRPDEAVAAVACGRPEGAEGAGVSRPGGSCR